MGKAPTWDQESFRGRDDDVGLNVDTWNGGGGLNGDWTQDLDTNFRIRWVVKETNGVAGTVAVKAQYNHNDAGWVDVGAATPVKWGTSDQYADDEATSQLIGDGTFNAGHGSETDNIAPDSGSVSIGADEETEFEFVFQLDAGQVSGSDTVEVRLLHSDGTEFDTYTALPTITAAGAGELIERTVSDGIFLPDRVYREQEVVVRDGIFAPDQDSFAAEHFARDGLFLDDNTLPQAIRQALVRDGLFLDDREAREIDILLSDGLFLADAAARVLELFRSEGLLIGDTGTLQKIVSRTVSDGIFLVDRALREEEKLVRDALLLRDTRTKDEEKVLRDGLFVVDSIAAQKIIARLVADGLFLRDQTAREEEKIHRDSLLLRDQAVRELAALVRDQILFTDRAYREVHVSALEGLLIRDATTRVIEILRQEGLLTPDSATAQHILADIGSLITGILLGARDPLGVEVGYGRLVTVSVGAGDLMGIAVSAEARRDMEL